MNSSGTFFDKFKNIVDKGMDASKDFLSKAGDKVQDLSEKGVLKVEIMQLEHQLDKVYIQMGQAAAKAFSDNPESVLSATDAPFESAMMQVASLKEQINQKKEAASAASDTDDQQ